MDHHSQKPLTRQEVLKTLVVLPALAAGLAATTAVADAKGTKAAFKYQDKPSGSHDCENCKLFIPGKTKSADGTCKVVAGSISPKGWCIAYTPA